MTNRAQILITAIDQTKSALASVKGNLEGLSVAASKVNGVLAGLGAALSLGALVAAGKAALDTADNLAKLAQKTGISVESLSLLKPIAEQSGISLEGLANGMQKLATAMVEAAGGAKEQVEVFSRLGISVKGTAGSLRPTEEVLLDLADAFAAMPDGAEKSALAVKLFGKNGTELIPFLNQGRTGIEQLKQKFRELGLEISGNTAKAAEKFNDTLDTVKLALRGIALKVAEAALPALQRLADGLVAIASHGEEIMTALRALGDVIVAVLAVKGVAAVAALGGALAELKAALLRFLPILAAVAVWEMGRGLVKLVQEISATNRALDEMSQQRQQMTQLSAAMDELANTGALSVKSQMMLAAQAAEQLKAALPGMADALRTIRGTAPQVGEAIRQALDTETRRAAESVKQLASSYRQVAADIKAVWDARVAEIESNYQRQVAAAQHAARSEATAIRESAQALLSAERDKLAAVEQGARQMETAWKATYGQAVQLARAAGQDVAAIERQATDARIALYSQLESAYRATVDRLIAEEQRHLQAAKAADEARLNLRLSVEDRIRELSRKGMDEYAAYQDRLRQIDEKQAQARAALAVGNFEQARKLAEESMQLAERSASAITRQVEIGGKTVTQTVLSDAEAAKTAIGQIKESAAIADAALKGLGDAHKQAASAAGQGADEARRALASISAEVEKLRADLLKTDKLKLELDIGAAKADIEQLKALTEAQALVAKVQADTGAAQKALEDLQAFPDNHPLQLKFAAANDALLADLDQLQALVSDRKLDIPAVANFEAARRELAAYASAAAQPTASRHTVTTNADRALAEVARLNNANTSSTHTIYLREVQTHAAGGLIRRLAAGGSAVAQGFRRMAGRITGPGTETSDSIPALLSHGEYVIRASSVRKFGESFFAALNGGFLPPMPRYALGGLVPDVASNAGTGGRDVVDLRIHLGGKTHTVQSSRDTAMQLARALRDLSRGA